MELSQLIVGSLKLFLSNQKAGLEWACKETLASASNKDLVDLIAQAMHVPVAAKIFAQDIGARDEDSLWDYMRDYLGGAIVGLLTVNQYLEFAHWFQTTIDEFDVAELAMAVREYFSSFPYRDGLKTGQPQTVQTAVEAVLDWEWSDGSVRRLFVGLQAAGCIEPIESQAEDVSEAELLPLIAIGLAHLVLRNPEVRLEQDRRLVAAR